MAITVRKASLPAAALLGAGLLLGAGPAAQAAPPSTSFETINGSTAPTQAGLINNTGDGPGWAGPWFARYLPNRTVYDGSQTAVGQWSMLQETPGLDEEPEVARFLAVPIVKGSVSFRIMRDKTDRNSMGFFLSSGDPNLNDRNGAISQAGRTMVVDFVPGQYFSQFQSNIAGPNGDISAYDGGSFERVIADDFYVANRWYDVRIEFDCDTDTYDVYVDNQKKNAAPLAFYQPQDHIDRIDVYTGSLQNPGPEDTPGSRNWIDDIRVVSLVPPPDDDEDGIPDVTDNCPVVPNANQIDTDLDGQGDACDSDNDNDGVLDVVDNCKFDANPTQSDIDGDHIGDACDADADGDGIIGNLDNCPLFPNVDQTDTDHDGIGDDCDSDDDNDGVCDVAGSAPGCSGGPDNCATIVNPDQQDLEGDRIGDACDADLDGDGIANQGDNCPVDVNVDQNDVDGDGVGDRCDTDIDGDQVANASDNCPNLANTNQADLDHDGLGDVCDADVDGDGIPSSADNCPVVPNSDQLNFDGDGFGDACDSDTDGDHVANGVDQCPWTPAGALIDAGAGCSIAQLCPCAGPAGTTAPWQNHGKYVSCVAHVSTDFERKGIISSAQRATIQSAAGSSQCGK